MIPSENTDPPKKTRRRHLETITDVKRTLARVLRAVEKKQGYDLEKARVLIYGLSKLAGIMQASDFEERLARLESPREGVAVQ